MRGGLTSRVLVAGVGYRDLRDHSVGILVAEEVERRRLPGVRVEDLSYNPIAVGQRLQEEAPFHRGVFVSGVQRPGRQPGTVQAYRWDGELPPLERVQRAVADAVTGVILLDNTLIVLRQFGGLPEETVVVEVEPAVEAFGDELSPPVDAVFESVCDLVARLALLPDATLGLPRSAFGGRPPEGS